MPGTFYAPTLYCGRMSISGSRLSGLDSSGGYSRLNLNVDTCIMGRSFQNQIALADTVGTLSLTYGQKRGP